MSIQQTQNTYELREPIQAVGIDGVIKLSFNPSTGNYAVTGKLTTKHIEGDPGQLEEVLGDWASMWEKAAMSMRQMRRELSKKPNEPELPFPNDDSEPKVNISIDKDESDDEGE